MPWGPYEGWAFSSIGPSFAELKEFAALRGEGWTSPTAQTLFVLKHNTGEAT